MHCTRPFRPALVLGLFCFALILNLTAVIFAQRKGIDAALLAKAKAGDADAEQRIADIYAQSGNDKESCRWERMAAQNGNAMAQDLLAAAYEKGFCGLPKDYAQAAVWWRKAAVQGDSEAQDSLAGLYYNGQGVPQDYSQAATWSSKAAEQGEANSQYNLGLDYYYGQGVPQDYTQAEQWFLKAAELRQGNSGGEPNWIRMVVDKITANAQYMLGVLYANGQGVPRDDSQAAIWFRKAAEQGNADAQQMLGWSYLVGGGMPQDYAEAYFWLDLASSGKLEGSDQAQAAELRDAAASHLTRTVLLQTQQRARKWFEEHPAEP